MRVRDSYPLRLATALLVLVSVVVGVGAVTYVQTSNQLRDEVQEQTMTEARGQARTVAGWREERIQLTRRLANFNELQVSVLRAIDRFLKDEISNVPDDVQNIHYVNTTTTEILASSNGRFSGTRLSRSSATWAAEGVRFQNSREVTVTPVYRFDGTFVVAFVTRVPRQADRMLVVTARVQALDEHFSQTIPGSFTQVVDRDGTIVVDQRGDDVGGQYLDGGRSAVVAAGARGETGFRADTARDAQLPRDYLVAFTPVEGTDWVLVLHADAREAYAVRREIADGIVAFVLLALVGILGIAGLVGRNTARAVTDLADAAEAISAGEYDTEITSERSDELGTLATSLAAMRDSLVSREQQAQVLNRVLRHNLRTRVNVLLGKLSVLERHVDVPGEDDPIGVLERQLRDVLETSRKARRAQQVLESERVTVDLSDLVTETVTQADTGDATVETDLPTIAEVRASSAVRLAVEELLENARTYHDGEDPPRIRVAVSHVGDHVELTVTDDGPGLPDDEQSVLTGRREGPLEHGSGLGLWIVCWAATASGGSVDYARSPAGGSEITMRFQAATD